MLLIEPTQAHQALASAWRQCKAELIAGHRLTATFSRYEEDRTVKQNRFYWGVVLKQISRKARIEGASYTDEAWHELFKREFLGYEIKKVTVAGSKRKRVIRRLRSTTGLKVKPMSVYLEKIQAFAATDLGVTITERWETWDGREVDLDTGEIILREGETA